MNNKLLTLLILCAGAVLTAPVQAQQYQQSRKTTFSPGYVDYPVPLNLFVPASLIPACNDLQKGNHAAAEKAFAQAIQRQPGDFGTHFGFVQATNQNHVALTSRYLKEADRSGLAVDEFKLGVAALYALANLLDKHDKAAQNEKYRLMRLTYRGLSRAYDRTHAPIAGFTLAFAYPLLGGGDPVPVYEDMLQQIGGDTVYKAYANAKANGWAANQPPVPDLPKKQLRILRGVLGKLYSKNSGRGGMIISRTVNGRLVLETKWNPQTPEQKRAMAFLDGWILRLERVTNEA